MITAMVFHLAIPTISDIILKIIAKFIKKCEFTEKLYVLLWKENVSWGLCNKPKDVTVLQTSNKIPLSGEGT